MTENYHILIQKLDEFIRKYYRNLLIKGVILFVALFLFSYLVVAGFEYFGHFGPTPRTILFYLFLTANGIILYHYILTPLLKLSRIGKVISHEQASEIIGTHFTDVRDKLLNTLQLQKMVENSSENVDLLKAGIDQKIGQLKPIPFTSAIDLSKNRKFLKYALPPLVVLLGLLLISPTLITKPTERIIHHTQVFAEELPFTISILNKSLEVFQQEDFQLKVKVTGEKLPDELFIESEGITYKLSKESKIHFSYTFKSLQRTQKFRIVAGKYKTGEYEILVFPKPTILNFEVSVQYPPYLNRKQEVIENAGDLIVPEGSKVLWKYYTKDVDQVQMRFEGNPVNLPKESGNTFTHSLVVMKSMHYTICAFNPYVKNADSLKYTIMVIQDAMPSISVKEVSDSLIPSRIYFTGLIKDDYGFSKLTFTYATVTKGDTTVSSRNATEIPINKALNQQQFYYSVDLAQFVNEPGKELNYYFEVCDNDGIHGAKCARTMIFKFAPPTPEEIEKATSEKEEKIEKSLENALTEAKKLQKQIDDMGRKMTEKNSLSWQDKKQLEEMLQKEKQIKETLENLEKQNEQKNNFEQMYNPPDSSIMAKQRELSKLFQEVMDDELKKMVEDIKSMMDKIDKNQVNQMLDKMKMTNKDLEKQLDRSLELYKQVEFDKKLTETIDNLNKLAEQQEKLAESTLDKENSDESLKQQQEELQKQFEQEKKSLDELEEKNKKLDEPNSFPNTEKEQQEIQKEMNQSKEELQKQERKSSSKSQKNAAKSMKSLAGQLQKMKEDSENSESAEDFELLRQVLENLVRISFDQEDLMNRTKVINRNDPKYLNIIQEQNDLKADLKVVEDSLTQLAKRQIMIKPFITREIASINSNVDLAVKNLEERNIGIAAAKQQYIMTSVNNLALMLAESLKKMESQMQGQCKKPGNSSCNNPGGSGKKSMKSLRQMQEQLNKQMQGLKKEMESQSKGGPNKTGSSGNRQMSEKLARMAAEQEAIRNEMKKYQDQMNEQGIKPGGEMSDAMQKMEETERDLVNKRILQETINRQQEILTRLLESERAELKREQEERRESNEAKNQKYSNPNGNFQYNKARSSDSDMLKMAQPSYNYYYKTKIASYFLKFE